MYRPKSAILNIPLFSVLLLSQEYQDFPPQLGFFLLSKDSVPVEKVREFEKELHSILNMQYGQLLDDIESKKTLDSDLKEQLGKAIKECQSLFVTE